MIYVMSLELVRYERGAGYEDAQKRHLICPAWARKLGVDARRNRFTLHVSLCGLPREHRAHGLVIRHIGCANGEKRISGEVNGQRVMRTDGLYAIWEYLGKPKQAALYATWPGKKAS